MPIQGIATAEEKNTLSTQLAFLYLEKSDLTGVSPSEFAEKYFEVKKEIRKVVSERSHL